MKLLSLCLLLCLSNQTGNHSRHAIVDKVEMQECGPSITERLRDHFDRYEIRPDLVVNNNEDFGVVKSKRRTIKLANHRIVWITKAANNDVETSIKIDNETISLKKKISLNNADGDQKIELNLVNDWDQIKLYTLGNHEIIGITLTPIMCTGLMCGVSAQLLYDVTTKSKTFFGAFRANFDVKLFRFSQDDTPYYVTTNFDGDPHGVTTPATVSYELYKIQSYGQFLIRTDTAGEKYFIKHTIFPDREIKGDEVVPKIELTPDKLEHYWIKTID